VIVKLTFLGEAFLSLSQLPALWEQVGDLAVQVLTLKSSFSVDVDIVVGGRIIFVVVMRRLCEVKAKSFVYGFEYLIDILNIVFHTTQNNHVQKSLSIFVLSKNRYSCKLIGINLGAMATIMTFYLGTLLFT